MQSPVHFEMSDNAGYVGGYVHDVVLVCSLTETRTNIHIRAQPKNGFMPISHVMRILYVRAHVLN